MNKIKLSYGALAFLLAVCSNLVIQFLGSLVLLGLKGDAYDIASYFLMALLQVANIIIALFVIKKSDIKAREILCPIKAKTVGFSALVLLVTLLSSYMLVLWTNVALQNLGVTAGSVRTDGYFLILALITTGVLAPIGEEIVYRFVLLNGLKEKFSPLVAIILSAIAFAFMHFNPYQTVYQIAFGIALGLVVTKTGNIAYSIIMHALNNVTVLILSLLPSFDGYLVSHFTLLILAIALFIAGAIALYFIFREKHQQKKESKGKEINGISYYVIALVVCSFMWLMNFVV